jgi:hypothetical protein
MEFSSFLNRASYLSHKAHDLYSGVVLSDYRLLACNERGFSWFYSKVNLNLSFAGSNPAEGDGFLNSVKFRSSLSFGGEVKPSVPCRKVLRLAKITSKYEQRYFEVQINYLRQVPPDLLVDYSAGKISRGLWWTNQGFPLSIL